MSVVGGWVILRRGMNMVRTMVEYWNTESVVSRGDDDAKENKCHSVMLLACKLTKG